MPRLCRVPINDQEVVPVSERRPRDYFLVANSVDVLSASTSWSTILSVLPETVMRDTSITLPSRLSVSSIVLASIRLRETALYPYEFLTG